MDSTKLRIVPTAHGGPSSHTASIRETANALGVHDTFRHGQRSLAADINDRHPHQMRLESWEETQDSLRLNLQRNVFGIHAPMRQLMERKIVSSSYHMPNMARSNIHLDILMGRDEALDVADFFGTPESSPLPGNGDERALMEKKHHI